MRAEVQAAITAFTRFELVAKEKTEGTATALAEKIGVSKAWVTDIRRGKQTVGAEAMMKLAELFFGGDIGAFQRKATEFAKANPHRVSPSPEQQENTQPDRVIFRLWLDANLVVTLASQGLEPRGKMRDFSDNVRNAIIAVVHMLGYSFEQVTEAVTEIQRDRGPIDDDLEPPLVVELLRGRLNGKPRSGTYPSSSRLRVMTKVAAEPAAPRGPKKKTESRSETESDQNPKR